MNSTKLKKFSQRKRPLPSCAQRIREIRLQLESLYLGDVVGQKPRKLDGISFVEYCSTLRIKTTEGIKPFELFPWQEEFTALLTGPTALSQRQISLLSSRQTGKTSVLLALMAYLAQSREQFTGIIVHRKTEDAHLLARRVGKLLGGEVDLSTDSLSLIEFAETKSVLHFRSANPGREDGAEGVGRGIESADIVYVEEASHTRNLADVVGVAAPCMTWSDMGLMLFVGTAGSKQSYFYDSLAKAAGGGEKLERLLSGIREGLLEPYQQVGGSTGPLAVVTHWRAIERFRDDPDFLKKIKDKFNLSDEQIATEYQLDFASSADNAAFDFALVMAAAVESGPPEFSEKNIYYLGVDPSGQGRDYSVCLILEEFLRDEKRCFRVAKLYRKRSGTAEQHLSKISELIEKHDPIAVTIEQNGMGAIWLEGLSSLGLSHEIDGFSTSQKSKQAVIGRLTLALERGALELPKGPIIDELLAFRRTESGRFEASSSAHDDCVMALALALQSAKYS